MDMNAPAPRNAIDENRQGLIGKPVSRVEGRLKVTGKAPYAHEVVEGAETKNAAYGFIVDATIAKGTVASIDTEAAERSPGVMLVMTHKNAPAQGAWGPIDAKDRYARASPQLGNNRIEHYGQAVAFVVAKSFEQARSAARLVKINYAQQKP
jgi:xanthine dehydrogenase YagR molybdenum-binding subunit